MELTPQGIPIIDLAPTPSSDKIPKHISTACEEGGCFHVKNHGIDQDTIKNAFDDLRTFFKQSTDYKLGFVDPNGNLDRGYEPFETRNVNAFMGRHGLPNDPLEKYAFGPPSGFVRPIPENIWPDMPATLRRSIESYYGKVNYLAERLMKLFSIAARAPNEEYFYERCHNGEHILRANFYPSGLSPKPMQATRFGEHTDSTPFTILAMDDCPNALQVKKANNEWVYADPVPDALFVNLGDFMAIWTNDKWKATVHKVVWPDRTDGKDRLSLVYFLLMNPGAVAECLPSCVEPGESAKYKPTSHADYVKQRMEKLAGRY